MQAVIYLRISRDREGAGLGVERQRADCQQLADRLGWTVADVFTDNDVSAFTGRRRPGYEAMLAVLRAGRAAAVIAWHTDRLHRRPVELEDFIKLCDEHGIEVRTVQAGEIDLGTASGRMVARMLGAAARHEVEHAIERQRRAKQQAAAEGRYRGGRRAFGYEPDGITAQPAEAAAIRQAADDVLAGVSLRQIARTWNTAGLRTTLGGNEFTSREVRKILLRPRNAGLSMHDGRPVAEGQWEHLVGRDTYDALVALLIDATRAQHIATERRYQGSGVYVCGRCGAPMVGASHNKRAGQWRRTYVCSAAKHLGRDVEHVDNLIDRIVVGRLSMPDAPIALGGPAGMDIPAVRAERDQLRVRLDELGRMFAAGDIDGAQLRHGTTELRGRLDRVDRQLAAARAASSVANLVLSGDDLAVTWAATPPDVRGKVIGALMSVTILPAGRGRQPGGTYFDPATVRVTWREP